MTTHTAKVWIELLKFNNNVIHMQLKDITHAESLLQLPFRGNCMNWVIGHILGIRHECLAYLGLPGVLTDAEVNTYQYGSEPITSAEQASDLESMVKRLDESLEALTAHLEGISREALFAEVDHWMGKRPIAEALSFAQWHEAYHTGQLEQLRQLTGKNDKVI